MQSITLLSEEHKELIRLMKRERKPSHRLRMHIVVLASDGYSPTQISRVLFCSRTTVYAITHRASAGKVERPSTIAKAWPESALGRVGSKEDRDVGGRGFAYGARLVALTLELLSFGVGALWGASPAPQPRDGSPCPAPP